MGDGGEENVAPTAPAVDGIDLLRDDAGLAHILGGALQRLFAGCARILKIAGLVLQMALEFKQNTALSCRIQPQPFCEAA
jgi:hypothetical protein